MKMFNGGWNRKIECGSRANARGLSHLYTQFHFRLKHHTRKLCDPDITKLGKTTEQIEVSGFPPLWHSKRELLHGYHRQRHARQENRFQACQAQLHPSVKSPHRAYMVKPRILAGVLKAHDILDTLHNADRSAVSSAVATDRTYFCLGYIVTDGAVTYATPHVDNRFPSATPFPSSMRSMWSASLNAVFRPMPGNRDNSQRSSSSFDANSCCIFLHKN